MYVYNICLFIYIYFFFLFISKHDPLCGTYEYVYVSKCLCIIYVYVYVLPACFSLIIYFGFVCSLKFFPFIFLTLMAAQIQYYSSFFSSSLFYTV